jgi:pimeloyl-ACP methyl ester carboxylesterase
MADTIQISHPLGCISGLAFGDPANPKRILAIHGWLDNAESFRSLGDELKDRYYLVAVDLPGHGHSFHRQLYPYHFVDWVFDMEWILKELKWTDYGLIAHSMGAVISVFFAALCKNKPHFSVFLDALLPIYTSAEQSGFSRLESFYTDAISIPKASRTLDLKEAVRARLKNGVPLPEELAIRVCERNLKDNKWRFDPKLRWRVAFKLDEQLCHEVLAKLPANSHVIWGKKSTLSLYRKKITLPPQLQSIELDTGHYPHVEDPNEFRKYLEREVFD